ncbi:MAG: acetyl-CoA carboxylase biotin carboxyl carrier protein [Planctomycetaceae bacterium]|nr:acetyl-CoA carboxylase biotin carboxyl carrier protein [Planctomycetaceae bacterium]
MAEDSADQGNPFDLERVRTLMEMMEKHGLTEVSLKQGDQQWKFRRGPETVQMVGGPSFAMPSMPAAAPAPVAAASAPAAAAPAADPNAGMALIKSPTVGTFYAAPSPADPAYVTVGSRVSPDTVVCQVEAMKVFNQIAAECAGTVAEILVKNGDAVEFGQVLFRVRPG